MRELVKCPMCNNDGEVCVTDKKGWNGLRVDVWDESQTDPEWITCPVCKGHKRVEKATWTAFHLRFPHHHEMGHDKLSLEALKQFAADITTGAGT